MRLNKCKEKFSSNNKGLTIIELSIVVGIGSLMTAALMAVVIRSFDISRRQIEQGMINENARIQLEHMSDEIRNAKYIDCNLDNDSIDVNEHWLITGDEYELTLYSNIDDDVEAERIRYFVDTASPSGLTDLKRGVTQPGVSLCDYSGTEEVSVVLKSLRNITNTPAIPMFHYYSEADDTAELDTPISNPASVLRVRFELAVDESQIINPDQARVATDIVPRSVFNPGACLMPEIDVTRYNYSENFADIAYAACLTRCSTGADLPIDEYCGWSTAFAWQGNPNWYVWASCECKETYLPPGLTPESINPGAPNYTNFAKSCLDGTKCSGQKGRPICNANNLTQPGQCVCECPEGLIPASNCNDGIDNDNDGATDFDGGDGGLPDTGCSDAADTTEYDNNGIYVCDDNIDNDGDGDKDYKLAGAGDVGCGSITDTDECNPYETGTTAQCSDGIDNDCDGAIDYDPLPGTGDDGCENAADNNEWHFDLPQCGDTEDNDGDGDNNFPDDSECLANTDTSEFLDETECIPGGYIPGVPECSDGLDNDCDTTIDWSGGFNSEPADADCSGNANHNNEVNSLAQCSDGIDNDNDGTTDWDGFPSDLYCEDANDDNEYPGLNNGCVIGEQVFGLEQCQDGIDNDCDGTADYNGPPPFPPDEACVTAGQYWNNEYNALVVQCSDGFDNDGDNEVDFDGGGAGANDTNCVDAFGNPDPNGEEEWGLTEPPPPLQPPP